MDIVGQILKVESSLTKTQKTKYEVSFSDGQVYVTFDSALAGVAASLANQTVVADVNVEQKGKYTNRYFNGAQIAPAGTVVNQPVAAQPAGVVAAAPAAVHPGIVDVTARREQAQADEQSQRSKKMSRGNALNALSRLYVGAGDELDISAFLKKADFLARYVETGVWPGQGATATQTPAPAAAALVEQVVAQPVVSGQVEVGPTVAPEIAPVTDASGGEVSWT